MYKVWHVDKYKIIFKFVINWINEIFYHIVVSSGLSRPGITDARPRYRAAARRLRNTAIQNVVNFSTESLKPVLANQGSVENFGDYVRICELNTSIF